jgi:1-acyl-sn-glycerol-3-phosphate acyltransferase
MHRTIFTTPVVNTLLRGLSLTILKLTGWRVEGSLPPDCPKCVVIAAPHTSNWDLPNTLIAGFALRMNLYWMGKRSIFAPPFGALMRWLGGIAVNREKSTNLVAASVDAIRAADARCRKTGFYHIAHGAGVPIVLSYMDYARKISGLGPVFHPTGDIDRDMETIKAFYAPFKGKNPDQSGH